MTPDPPEQPYDAEEPSAESGTEEVEAHDASGLDLARAAARAAAAAGGPVATPRRTGRKPGDRGGFADSGRRGGRRGETTLSGPGPDRRDPRTVDADVRRLVAQRGWDADLRVHAVFARWAEIVGEEIGEHCRPESYVDGRLVVRTDATAWATQLRLLAPSLVKRLNDELGHGSVAAIEVLGPQAPSWVKGRRSVRGRGPRDTYG
ncbi:DUF721 domain-containing protein [Nocardioides zeae]